MSEAPIRIVAAAVVSNGMICTLPPPARHHNLLHALHDMKDGEGHVRGDCQGFITSAGHFIGRRDAYVIAKAAGQINRRPGGYDGDQLFSEDLW